MLITYESNLKSCYEIVDRIVSNVYDLWSSMLKNEIDIPKSENLSCKILGEYQSFMKTYTSIQRNIGGEALVVETLALRLH